MELNEEELFESRAEALLSHTSPTEGTLQLCLRSDLVPEIPLGVEHDSTAW